MCETRMAMRRESSKYEEGEGKRTRSSNSRRNPRRGGGGPRDGEYSKDSGNRRGGKWNVSKSEEQ